MMNLIKTPFKFSFIKPMKQSPVGMHSWRISPSPQISPSLAWRSLILAIALCCGWPLSLALAQSDSTFPSSPPDLSTTDPLLPRMVVDRPLSPQEQRVLTAALDAMQAEAAAKLRAGDSAGAFEIWNRELQLRQVLGVEAEVAALSRVGEIAWRESQTTEVRLITQRLQDIEQAELAQMPPNFALLLTIAQAYEKIRAYDPGVAAFERILERARQQQDTAAEQQTLLALGKMHLAWFNYAEAAGVYRELVELARLQGDRTARVEYMVQLASIYQENSQPREAIGIQQQLVAIYESQQSLTLIPPLKIAIGDNYRDLNRPDLAAPNYQEGFAIARSVQQYGYAGDALQRLADLYRSLNRLDDALVVYQLIIDVAQQSYSLYGMMDAYDQIGQIHYSRGESPQALAAFRRGLDLARQLSFKESYFISQIEAISQPATPNSSGQ